MLKRNPLTIGTLIFLCGYYLLALQNHALPFQGEEDSFDIFNARWLGGVGQVLNYWQNLTPQWIALGAKQPTHWYFHSRPDFYSPASLALTEIYSALENRDFIAAWRKQGLTVVILPIPAKSQIETDYIPEAWRQSGFDSSRSYRSVVEVDPKWTVDLYSVFKSYKANHHGVPVFRPLDVHWNSLGSALAAQATVSLLNERGWALTSAKLKFIKTLPDGTPGPGHAFLDFLFLPRFFIASRPELRWDEPIYDLAQDAEKRAGRLVVFGSSYSRDSQPLSYADFLSRASGLELVDLSIGGGNFVDGLKAARSKGVRLRRGDVVVLEFPLNQIRVWEQEKVLPEISGAESAP